MSRIVHAQGFTGYKLTGTLQVVVTNVRTGRKRRHLLYNTITIDGANSPLFLWAPDGIVQADWPMDTLRFGTSAVPPTVGDIGLGAPLAGGPSGGVISIASPSSRARNEATGEVIVSGQLDVNHANGFTLTEVGIYFANGRMGMRQVFPGVPKTNAITVSVTWRVACITS